MIVLVDGRSGSGKTELARALVQQHPSFQLVGLDGLYPGWHGLEAGSAAIPELLRTGVWRSWDWANDRPGEWREIDPAGDILVEGVGALTAASRPLAEVAVWVDLDDATRRSRALARDPYFAAHWDDWAAQEWEFIGLELPIALADELVDGHDVGHDLDRWRVVVEPARVDE